MPQEIFDVINDDSMLDEDGRTIYRRTPDVHTHKGKIWLKPAIVKDDISSTQIVIPPTAHI
ncbi:hypothetical protein [Companilactobacillus bobalius]|uniref:Uncharacterized protein n=2 Tax=Companilactobacillus bobalius TaxID=2801451 RepID=A0A202FFR1_9LACO|nr:hypothetical protein [Companilactobacillus bobalius]KAE9560304.1 hypothetical protein ATN92_09045 [Companilactobacillus bobalius]KRK83044.1 hypothetical protein FC78_GL001852 [Companilactobacillus bobalius DSM 19674]OVE99270.1 hypothetical protein LKACC16343_00382 [Companilactobacillus bobalius]GEO57247.1 hypothetical protein LBO01_03760 [Companilactobacillus paralimentarius]